MKRGHAGVLGVMVAKHFVVERCFVEGAVGVAVKEDEMGGSIDVDSDRLDISAHSVEMAVLIHVGEGADVVVIEVL